MLQLVGLPRNLTGNKSKPLHTYKKQYTLFMCHVWDDFVCKTQVRDFQLLHNALNNLDGQKPISKAYYE